MKFVVAVLLLAAAAYAAPQQNPEAAAQVVKSDFDNIGVDGYHYAYETSNKISQEESAQLKNAGTENEAIQVQGAFSYVGPDGVSYAVRYIADENGFQPEGAHLPVAPQ